MGEFGGKWAGGGEDCEGWTDEFVYLVSVGD